MKVLFLPEVVDQFLELAEVLYDKGYLGFSMLSVDTGDGFVSVNEGDVIVLEDDGRLKVVKQ